MAQLTAAHEAVRALEVHVEEVRKSVPQFAQPLLREYMCNALVLVRPRHIGQGEEGEKLTGLGKFRSPRLKEALEGVG